MTRLAAAVALAVPLSLSSCSEHTSTAATDWDLLAAGGRRIEILVWVGSSSCESLKTVETDETSSSVTLTAIIELSGDSDCTADLTTEVTTVDLESDLGNRDLRGCRPRDPATESEHREINDCSESAPLP